MSVVAIKPVGKKAKHAQLMVKHTSARIRKTIGWNLCTDEGTNWCTLLKPGDIIDIVFEISINQWNGNRELQLTIQDLKKSEA